MNEGGTTLRRPFRTLGVFDLDTKIVKENAYD